MPGPQLAVVVLAVGAPESAVDAVRSLLDQGEPVEIVVVNSSGGNMAARLRGHGIDVRVVEREDLLMVGAARNLGIQSSSAPYVAFLASDCMATRHWARNRLRRHARGASAVGSAVINSHRRNPFAWASHLALWSRRLPRVRGRALPYGASYDRWLFDRYGYFREDLRTGEDTEFHARLPPEHQPVWQPNVRTIHRNPTGLRSLMADQFARGARAARAFADLEREPMACGPAAWWKRTANALRFSRRTSPRDRRYVLMAKPIVPVAVAAYFLGARCWQVFRRGAYVAAKARHRQDEGRATSAPPVSAAE